MDQGRPPLKKVRLVFPSAYRADTNVTTELNDDECSYYMSIIGILRWAVELIRCTRVSGGEGHSHSLREYENEPGRLHDESANGPGVTPHLRKVYEMRDFPLLLPHEEM